MYYSLMTIIPPPVDFDTWSNSAVTWDFDLESRFARIIAENELFADISATPPDERLPLLLTAPIGLELMAQLQMLTLTDLDAAARLDVAHLWERCVAWVTAQAAEVCSEFIEAVTDPPEDRPYTRNGVPVAPGVCVREVGIATGMSDSRAAMRIMSGQALAADGPLAATGDAVRTGRISWEVAEAFVEATLSLTPERTTAVQDRVLPRAVAAIDPDTGAGSWRSRSWAVKALRRAVLLIDPDSAIKRRERASTCRDVTMRTELGTGMAYITAYLPADVAVSTFLILHALADARRRDDQAANPDDRPRSWGAARVDVLVEALQSALNIYETTGALPTSHGKVRIEVGVVVDLPTIAHLADHPGEILGYGPVDPEFARLLTAQADTWRRWLLEPVTGHLIDLGRTRYKPTQELRDYLLAAYPECTRPECTRHSRRADIDHAREWHDDGPTSADNLHPMCRTDHTDKSTGWSNARVNADGTVTHTSKHGRERTGEPYWKSFADNLVDGRQCDPADIPPF